MLLRLDRRSCSHFCMFPKVWSASHTPGNAPVYLNVYDLPPMNGYMYWAGLGIFHTGVEVHGVEYIYLEHMTIRVAESLRLSLVSVQASCLRNQYSWVRHAWTHFRLESLWNFSPLITVETPTT